MGLVDQLSSAQRDAVLLSTTPPPTTPAHPHPHTAPTQPLKASPKPRGTHLHAPTPASRGDPARRSSPPSATALLASQTSRCPAVCRAGREWMDTGRGCCTPEYLHHISPSDLGLQWYKGFRGDASLQPFEGVERVRFTQPGALLALLACLAPGVGGTARPLRPVVPCLGLGAWGGGAPTPTGVSPPSRASPTGGGLAWVGGVRGLVAISSRVCRVGPKCPRPKVLIFFMILIKQAGAAATAHAACPR
jgi:hypothetical protein